MADTLNDTLRTQLDVYVTEHFVDEDAVLQAIQAEAARNEAIIRKSVEKEID
jgi:hypothetical protein